MSQTPYSAGTVFLDVVPSFHNVQKTIARNSQALGKSLAVDIDKGLAQGGQNADKAGSEASKRYSGAFVKTLQARLKTAMANVGEIEIGVNGSKAEKDLAALYARMKALSDLNIDVDINGAAALNEARLIEAELDGILRDQNVDINLRTNAGTARAELEALRTAIDKAIAPSKDAVAAERAAVRERVNNAKIIAQTEKNMAAEAQQFYALRRQAAKESADAEIGSQRQVSDALKREVARRAVDLAAAKAAQSDTTNQAVRSRSDTDVAAAIGAIKARYEAEDRLASASSRHRIMEAAKGATGEIAAAEIAQQTIEEDYANINRAAARSAAERVALAKLAAMVEKSQSRAATQSTRSDFAQSTGQAANSFRVFNGYLLTALAIGPLLIPVLATIAAGIGAIGFAALGAVVGIGALVAGFGGIGGALKALGAVDKEKRKQSVGSSAPNAAVDTRGLRDAQLALARARQDAGTQIAAAAKRQQQAEDALTKSVVKAADAQRALISARRDAAEQLVDQNNQLASGLLDAQIAAYALQEAGFRLNSVLEDPQASTREKKVAQLNYDKEVQQFKELQIQNERLQRNVAEANAKGVEGSDLVVTAQANVVDATQSVADAQQTVVDASAEVTKARVDEARTIVDAETRVSDAMVDLQKKSVEAGLAGSAAMDNLNYAMSQLSPAGQRFAEFLFGLKPLLQEIRAAAQEGLLPGVQTGLEAIVKTYGPDFVKFIGGIAKILGDLAAQAGKALTQPFWQDFFKMIAKYAPIFLQQFGSVSESIFTMIAGVLQAFAPFSAQIGDAFVAIASAAADWGKNLAGSEGFTKFIAYVKDAGPKVFQLLGNLFQILVNLAIGLAPYADRLLSVLIGLTDWLASMDPGQVAALALGIGAIILAIQGLAGIIAIVSSIAGLLAGVATAVSAIAAAGGLAAIGAAILPILAVVAVVAAIIGLIFWIKNLWETNQQFHDAVVDIWGRIVSVWNNAVSIAVGIFNGLIDFFQTKVAPVFIWLYTNIIKPYFDFISGVFQVFWSVVSTIFNMISQIITNIVAPVFAALYNTYIKPPMDKVGQAISFVWENVIKPVFQALGDFISEKVAPAFQTGIDAISAIWNGMIEIAKKPVRFVVDTVINNGIIDTFNKLVDVFPGMTKVEHVKLPQGFAEGGVLPGYTPGRDVHRFWSPTAGRLDLSGGEGIMVPELTREIGPRRLARANRAARNGGSGLGFLGGFADGGILGWLGNAAGSVTDAISGAISSVGSLLSNPSGAIEAVVKALLGNDNSGFAGLVASMPIKAAQGISSFLKGIFSGSEKTAAKQGGTTGGIGWQAMEQIVRQAFPDVRFTSAFRPGAITAVGTTSYHSLGRAVDMAPSMMLFNWLSSMFPDSRELFYSPAGAAQILNGQRNPNLSPITRMQHFNHVHWAMANGGVMPNLYDNGGLLPPGLSMVANRTGKPEPVFTAEQGAMLKNLALQGGGRGDTIEFSGDVNGGEELAKKIANQIIQKKRDIAALYGMDSIGVMG